MTAAGEGDGRRPRLLGGMPYFRFPRWWWPEHGPAQATLQWRIDPAPDAPDLRRATRAGLRAARKALPGRGRVRVVAEKTRIEGSDLIVVHLMVFGTTPHPADWLGPVQAAFSGAFAASLGPHRQLTRLAGSPGLPGP